MADSDPQVTIVALEISARQLPTVVARFHPPNLIIDKAVPWTPAVTSTSDLPELTFTAALGRTLRIELLVDGADGPPTVQTRLDTLSRMARRIAETGPEDKRRPSMVELRFPGEKIPNFKGAIEALSIRYAELLADGTPSRAVAELQVREASRLSFKKKTT
jgi:hypothetical protein